MYISINVGMTNISVATLDQTEVPILVKKHFEQGKKQTFFTPSKIYIEDDFAYIGQIVNVLQKHNPSLNIVENIFPHLGTEKKIYTDNEDKEWTATMLLALILKKIKLDAEIDSAQHLKGVLVTIPSWFTNKQKKAIRQAFDWLEIAFLGFVEDYKAILAGYRFLGHAESLQRIVLYHFGGRHFQTQLLEINKGVIQLIWTSGQQSLGGYHINQKLITLLKTQFEEYFHQKPRAIKKNDVLFENLAEKIKIKLNTFPIPYAKELEVIDKQAFDVIVYQQQLEECIQPIVERTITLVQKGLEAVSWSAKDVHQVLLAGSSCHLKQVKTQLSTIFPVFLIKDMEVETVEVKGAALLAYHNLPNSQQYIETNLEDETILAPYSISLELKHANQTIQKKFLTAGIVLPSQHQELFSVTEFQQKKINLNIKKTDLLGDLLPQNSIIIIETFDKSPVTDFTVLLIVRQDKNIEWVIKEASTGKDLKFTVDNSPIASLSPQKTPPVIKKKENSKTIKISARSKKNVVKVKTSKEQSSHYISKRKTTIKVVKSNIGATAAPNAIKKLIANIIINNIT